MHWFTLKANEYIILPLESKYVLLRKQVTLLTNKLTHHKKPYHAHLES